MAPNSRIRDPSHAGSWYTASKSELNDQLDGWLRAVTSPVHSIGPRTTGTQTNAIPVSGARIIIAPHAGYSYSGPAAAWAYKLWDVSKAQIDGIGVILTRFSKRVFLLGPSHHHYLTKAALSKCDAYGTPLGNLVVDRELTDTLYKSGQFEWMSQSVDEEEHSLEMHLPYIYKVLSNFNASAADFPLLVPIMIGNTSPATERTLGRLLAPYLADPSSVFVVSSDFAHWGSRFRYTYYRGATGTATDLSSSARGPFNPPIHESIKTVDFECLGACESGSHATWLDTLEETSNTVCGRHPIGVIMAAVEELKKTKGSLMSADAGLFNFVRYERSSEVRKVGESSVSYASAFAVV